MIVDDDAWFLRKSDALWKLVWSGSAFADEPKLGAVTCNLEGPNEHSDQRMATAISACSPLGLP